MADKQHAALGASGSHRWMVCAGSIAAEEGKPDISSEYSRLGDAAHDIAERCLNKGVDADTFLYTVQEVEGEFITVDDEMVEAVQVFLDHVMSHITEPSDELFVEKRFDLAPLNPPGPMYGTADAVVWKPLIKHLHVDDYKHGAGVTVDAEENPQAMMYALGVVVDIRKKPDKITVSIVQPRGFHPDGPIREYTFDYARLVEFKTELFAAAEATQDPDAPRTPGSHCRWCKALPTCPAHLENTNAVVQADFAAAEEEVVLLVEPEELTIEQLSLILQRGSLIETWLRSVREYVVGMLDRGEEVPGYKLVPGRQGNRKWVDEQKIDKYLGRRKLRVGERFKKTIISPAAAEKLLKAKGEKLPEEYWSRSGGRPKLVPSTDSRPALPPSAQDAFTVPGATDV